MRAGAPTASASARRSSKPSTSRKSRAANSGGLRDSKLRAPSVESAIVPLSPLTQTTRSSTTERPRSETSLPSCEATSRGLPATTEAGALAGAPLFSVSPGAGAPVATIAVSAAKRPVKVTAALGIIV